MIGSSGNSGGVVVGALVCGIECSGFKSRFILCFFFSFSLVEIFLSSREPFQHGASIACCTSAINVCYSHRVLFPPMGVTGTWPELPERALNINNFASH